MIEMALALALAAPAAGSATGSLSVDGKPPVPLAHAAAFNAGARIYLELTDKLLPPDQNKSEFEMAMYRFQNKVTGIEVVLDSTRKVTEVTYLWELAGKKCTDCFAVTIEGGPNGPLAGTIKTTAKGEAAKVKLDAAFSAPFVKASAAKK